MLFLFLMLGFFGCYFVLNSQNSILSQSEGNLEYYVSTKEKNYRQFFIINVELLKARREYSYELAVQRCLFCGVLLYLHHDIVSPLTIGTDHVQFISLP